MVCTNLSDKFQNCIFLSIFFVTYAKWLNLICGIFYLRPFYEIRGRYIPNHQYFKPFQPQHCNLPRTSILIMSNTTTQKGTFHKYPSQSLLCGPVAKNLEYYIPETSWCPPIDGRIELQCYLAHRSPTQSKSWCPCPRKVSRDACLSTEVLQLCNILRLRPTITSYNFSQQQSSTSPSTIRTYAAMNNRHKLGDVRASPATLQQQSST